MGRRALPERAGQEFDACMKMVAAFNRVDAWLQQFTKGGFDGAETDIEVQVAARQGFLWATVAQKCMLQYSISIEPMPVKLDELGDCLET